MANFNSVAFDCLEKNKNYINAMYPNQYVAISEDGQVVISRTSFREFWSELKSHKSFSNLLIHRCP